MSAHLVSVLGSGRLAWFCALVILADDFLRAYKLTRLAALAEAAFRYMDSASIKDALGAVTGHYPPADRDSRHSSGHSSGDIT